MIDETNFMDFSSDITLWGSFSTCNVFYEKLRIKMNYATDTSVNLKRNNYE